MAAASIERYFLEIDEIQDSVFDRIHQLCSLDSETLKDGESYEDRRSALSRSANSLMSKIPDLCLVIDIELKQLNEEEAAESLLHDKLALYIENWRRLKLKLKQSLLEAHALEMDMIHKQRIAEYVKVEEKEGTKEDLFAGRSQGKAEASEKSVQDQILTHNKNITSSLQLTKQLMSMSVMQTELNIDTIVQQSKDLGNLNDKLMDLEGVLTKSKEIVRFIERQDKRDKKRIYMSILFLLCCSAWVIWRRILKTPVRILLWTLFKFFGLFNWASNHLQSEKVNINGREVMEPLETLSSTSLSHTNVASSLSHTNVASSFTEVSSLANAYTNTQDEQPEDSITSIAIETETNTASSAENGKAPSEQGDQFHHIEEEVEKKEWVVEPDHSSDHDSSMSTSDNAQAADPEESSVLETDEELKTTEVGPSSSQNSFEDILIDDKTHGNGAIEYENNKDEKYENETGDVNTKETIDAGADDGAIEITISDENFTMANGDNDIHEADDATQNYPSELRFDVLLAVETVSEQQASSQYGDSIDAGEQETEKDTDERYHEQEFIGRTEASTGDESEILSEGPKSSYETTISVPSELASPINDADLSTLEDIPVATSDIVDASRDQQEVYSEIDPSEDLPTKPSDEAEEKHILDEL